MLLKGVNDDPKMMMKLMHELLKARVRPYYLYMADQVAGGEHFRTTVQKGLEIMQALRGWTSGLAVPHFVIDAPGGGGKVPLLPEYVEEINDDEVIFRNYAGQAVRLQAAARGASRSGRSSSRLPKLVSCRSAGRNPQRRGEPSAAALRANRPTRQERRPLHSGGVLVCLCILGIFAGQSGEGILFGS